MPSPNGKLVGHKVKIDGLVNAVELNGVVAKCQSYIKDAGRYVVKVASTGAQHKVKPINLSLLPTAPVPKRVPGKRPQNWSKTTAFPRDRNSICSLAAKWQPETDNLRGFVAMEKYDGFRAIWDGKLQVFVTRSSNHLKPAPSLAAVLPADMRLDGELFAGRGNFDRCARVLHSSSEEAWQGIDYIVFDAPAVAKGFTERLAAAAQRVAETVSSGRTDAPRVRVTSFDWCEDKVRRRLDDSIAQTPSQCSSPLADDRSLLTCTCTCRVVCRVAWRSCSKRSKL